MISTVTWGERLELRVTPRFPAWMDGGAFNQKAGVGGKLLQFWLCEACSAQGSVVRLEAQVWNMRGFLGHQAIRHQ